jgi:uncharacterized protein (UPF0332 family)
VSEPGQELLAWEHAEEHLREALNISPELSPRAVIHASYYAMFHAARACLLRIQNNAPKKHDTVMSSFGLLAKDRSETMKQVARDFNEVRALRRIADYSDTAVISADKASRSMELATSFLARCAQEFSFGRS